MKYYFSENTFKMGGSFSSNRNDDSSIGEVWLEGYFWGIKEYLRKNRLNLQGTDR